MVQKQQDFQPAMEMAAFNVATIQVISSSQHNYGKKFFLNKSNKCLEFEVDFLLNLLNCGYLNELEIKLVEIQWKLQDIDCS